MPDAPTLDALHRLISSPFFGLFLAAGGIAAIAILAIRLIAKIADGRNRTLESGNRALEQIETRMAVQTAHAAAVVESSREVARQLERIGNRLDAHDRDEEARHRETLREIRERDDG